MRDIKFRAWTHKGMTEPFTIGEAQDKDFPFVLDEQIVMQYTGLKDKNGKEIYEGDILNENSSVQWNEILLQWEVVGGLMLWAYRKDRLEVIGNIYENPELFNT